MLQASTKPPIIATDGSVKPYTAQGTFAWVLADPDSNPWLRCRGPVSGTQIDSFCSEAHALLSVLVYLNLLEDHFMVPVSAIKISAQKQSRPSSPSITSGITGTSPSTLALGSSSYASVVARPTPDPHILELKEQLAD
jgi:hypothetical protein